MDESKQSITAVIDASLCGGHGRCFEIAPTVFEPNEEGNGRVREEFVDPQHLGDAVRASQLCPEEAISLVTNSA